VRRRQETAAEVGNGTRAEGQEAGAMLTGSGAVTMTGAKKTRRDARMTTAAVTAEVQAEEALGEKIVTGIVVIVVAAGDMRTVTATGMGRIVWICYGTCAICNGSGGSVRKRVSARVQACQCACQCACACVWVVRVNERVD
jgi:hypothetical protein